MLTLQLLRGYNINKKQHIPIKKLYRSSSCFSFSPAKKVNNHEKLFFSIYQGSKIFKAPTLGQVEKGMRTLSHQIRKNKFNETNRLHKHMMQQSLRKKINSFYLTQSFYDHNNDIRDYPLSQRDFSNSMREELDFSNEVKSYEELSQRYKKERMHFEIGTLFSLTNNASELARHCSGTMLMKNFSGIKKNRMNKIKEHKMNLIDNINNVYFRLLKNKQILEEEFESTFVSYVNFLQFKKKEEREILEKLQSQHAKLDFEVNKLSSAVIRIQRQMDKLVETRNFIIKVKEQKLNLPEFFFTLTETDGGEGIERELVEKYRKYINLNYKIFKSPEEFLEVFSSIERKNMQLLRENEKSKINVQIMRSQYEEMLIEEENYEKFIDKQITIKQKELKDKMTINKQLESQRNSLFSPRSIPIFPTSKSSILPVKQEKNHNKSFNREMLTILKYKDLLHKFPVYYSLLYWKIAKMICFFIDENILNVSEIISHGLFHNKEEIDKLLNLKLNKKNEDLVRPWCLRLLRLFERAILLILFKHNEYMSSEVVKKEIEKLIVFKQNKLKIKNAEEQRTMLENKRIFEQKKIIEKNKKILILPRRKVQSDYESFKKIKQKKIEEKLNLLKQDQPVFHDFIAYSDDEK